MSPSFFYRTLFWIMALLLTPAVLHAEPADELIAKGDAFYAKLQAAQALKYYLPAENLSRITCVFWCEFLANIAT